MRKRPFFFIGLSAFSSALVCSLIPYQHGVAVSLVAALFLFGASWFPRLHLSKVVAALTGAAAVLVAMLFAARMITVVEPQLALDGTTAHVTIRVEQAIGNTGGYIVRVEDGELKAGTKLCFWSGLHPIAPLAGDRLTAEVELVAAYDERTEDGAAAKANGVFLYAWPTADSALLWEDGQGDIPLHKRVVYTVRTVIHNTLYRRMSFEGAAFSEGLMLGVCTNIAPSIGHAFRASGVYHLLAVSGSHLVLITSAVFWVLGMLACPRRWRAALTLTAILLFTALCGFTASVNRAAFSAAVMLGGFPFRSRSDGLNSLGVAAIVMLSFDPFAIYDIGWQLSFAATLGLLLYARVWEREVTARLKRAMPGFAGFLCPLSTAFGATLCASLTTMPLSALHFGELSNVFLFGNLSCIPLSEALLLCNFLSVMRAWIAPLSEALFWVSERLSEWMTALTVHLAQWPFAAVLTSTWTLVWLFALNIALVLGYHLRRMRGVVCAAVVMFAVFTAGCGIHHVTERTITRLTVVPTQELAVTVQTHGTCGLIITADGDTTADAAMLYQERNIHTFDWVLWLGKPSHHATDLTAMYLPIEHLLVSDDPAQYANLPAARKTTAFHDGGALSFGDNGTLTKQGDVWHLQIGDATVLIVASDAANLASLPTAWRDVDVLLTASASDEQASIRADHTVCYCDYDEIDRYRDALPQALVAVTEEALCFEIDRNGNITLRE